MLKIQPMAQHKKTHSFGFARVDAGEKTERVRGVFSSVAKNYDVMNDLMSGGVHRLWKRSFVRRIGPRAHHTILDVAGGTGDISFLMHSASGGADITVSDINPDMLAVGQARAADRGLTGKLKWAEANAEKLPFADNTFDIYTIAFGLRNVTHIDTALREALRVLRPGGRFFCLEFSKPAYEPLEKLYDAFSFHVIPRIGELVAKDRASYQYLVESIREFPHQDELKIRMQEAGFKRADYTNLTGGIAAIHSGVKI
jgi:demethylmenaquinone methyltransferase/2-methoxy-6-polyprenyl-1,4-benzoquinol methylase